MSTPAKFIQITADASYCYALDADGGVWFYQWPSDGAVMLARPGGWVRCDMMRLPEPAA